MKKIMIVLVAFTVIFCFAACNKNKNKGEIYVPPQTEVVTFENGETVIYEVVTEANGEAATDAEGETLVSVVTAADRLNTALTIISCLEDNGIIGEVASVNVADLGNLELWYGQRFQVMLGDTMDINYKIKCLKSVVKGNDEQNSLKEYDSGILDISFTIKENQVIYDPFED